MSVPRADILRGRCLCGGITLEVVGVPGAMVLCHCGQCRRSSGAPFVSVFPVTATAVRIADPDGLQQAFRSSPHKERVFCRRCGSPLFSRRDGAAELRVRAGLFDCLDGLVPSAHIFIADAAPWEIIGEHLPRYPGLEPGRARLARHEEDD